VLTAKYVGGNCPAIKMVSNTGSKPRHERYDRHIRLSWTPMVSEVISFLVQVVRLRRWFELRFHKVLKLTLKHKPWKFAQIFLFERSTLATLSCERLVLESV
jgi:hypothetical protein